MQAYGALKKSPYYLVGPYETPQRDASLSFEARRERLAGEDDVLTLAAWARYFDIEVAGDIPTRGLAIANLRSLMAEVRGQYVLPTFHRNSLSVGAQVRGAFNESAAFARVGTQQLLVGAFVEDTFTPSPSWC